MLVQMGLRELSDEELLAAIAERDQDSVAVLFDRYGGLAFALALRVLSDHGTAEDVVQESFLSIWRQAASYDTSRGTARTWLLTVVRNRAVDRLRSNRIRVAMDRPIEGMDNSLGVSDVWAEVSVKIDREAIRESLSNLPAEQQEVIELAYLGGLTHVEIAERLSLPLGTVKGRMRIALRKLHSLLDPSEFEARSTHLAESS
jgi:RNA polymerase sigma-70 factor (ECF subfamily)